MAVVAERDWLGEIVRERLEAAEVVSPAFVVEIAEADALGPATIEKAWDSRGKSRGLDGVIKFGAELEDLRVGLVLRHATQAAPGVGGSHASGKLDTW
jgi:hypothetical protein